ncbi:hypothetical protein BVY02_02340, partial [bacterium J17]
MSSQGASALERDRSLTVDELILEHRENGRKLARSMLRKWRVRMPAEEIDSIVDLTLCEAAKRFDPDKGASFMTFFFYHLRGHLVRAVAEATQTSNMFMAFSQNLGIDVTEWSTIGQSENQWMPGADHSSFDQNEI